MLLKRLDRRTVNNATYGKLIISRAMIDNTIEVIVMTEDGDEIELHTFSADKGVESYYSYIEMMNRYAADTQAKTGVNYYHPELGEKPALNADMHAERACKLWFIDVLKDGLKLKGRGITEYKPGKYTATDRAFDKLKQEYKINVKIYLD